MSDLAFVLFNRLALFPSPYLAISETTTMSDQGPDEARTTKTPESCRRTQLNQRHADPRALQQRIDELDPTGDEEDKLWDPIST
jgi:hypothetical protein